MNRPRRPIQFSLVSLLYLTGGVASILASLLPHGAFGPIVGWIILAILYYRQGWHDLLFVHGVLPGISLSMLAILAVATASNSSATAQTYWAELASLGYWLLFASCLIGIVVSQIYYVYLLLVLGPEQRV